MQQAFGQIFVLCNGLSHRAGLVHFSGLKFARLGAPAQLHQAAGGQTAKGNAAPQRCVEQRPGGWADALFFIQLAQFVDGGLDVKFRVVQGRIDQLLRKLNCALAHGFFRVFHDDLECAGLYGGVCATEGDGAASLGLHGQRSSFQHMGDGQGVVHALALQPANGRKACTHLVFKTRDQCEVLFFRRAMHDGFDSGIAAPEVGAAQGAGARNFHGLSFRQNFS